MSPTAYALALPLIAAILSGGGFEPLPALIVGLATCVSMIVVIDPDSWHLETDERIGLGLLSWLLICLAVRPVWVIEGCRILIGLTVGWWLWVEIRRLDQSSRRILIRAISAACVPLALSILFASQFAEHRVGGLFFNPNLAAIVLTAAVFLPRAFSPRMSIALRILFAVAALFTLSRSTLLALLVGGLILAPRRQRLALVVLGGSAAAVAIGWRFAMQPDPFAWTRPKIWLAVLQASIEHPIFGLSPGGLEDLIGPFEPATAGLAQFPKRISNSESTPLALFAAGGVPVLAMALGAALPLIRSWRRLSGLGQATILALSVQLGLHDLVVAPAVLWIVLAALALSLPQTPPARRMPTPVGRRLIAVAIATGVLASTWLQPSVAGLRIQEIPVEELEVTQVLELDRRLDSSYRQAAQACLDLTATWGWTDAARCLALAEAAVRSRPYSATDHHRLGQIRSKLAGLDRRQLSLEIANQSFVRAAALNPNLVWPRLELARSAYRESRPEDALREVQVALQIEPNCVPCLLLKTRMELDLGDIRGARTSFATARAAHASNSRWLPLYTRQLLFAPQWQWRELRLALR